MKNEQLKNRACLSLEVMFWIPIWIAAGAWCSLRDGLKDAKKSWDYF